MNKPVVLSDLDDTLFQTRRKMADVQLKPFRSAALDRELKPRSFMTVEQSMLVDWFLLQAELIPVTARGTEEINRVQIPFDSWAITTHGAVILTPEGKPDQEWQTHMCQQLAPYREKLIAMQRCTSDMMAARGINAWARLNREYDDVPVYMVMKHRDSSRLHELHVFADEVEQLIAIDGFYIHRNGNNIAWLPTPVEKGLAVSWLLNKLRLARGVFPVIGIGDSLSDYRFMQLCQWFAIPRQSQFADAIAQRIFREK